MIVTLIGYRGCGKSSVGPLLADRLGCHCIDSDDRIEQRTGKSITTIFAEDGEQAFRQLETDVLEDLLDTPPVVVAAGGGAILAKINCERMRAAGPVVWLKASAETLAGRIHGDESSGDRRPSLTGKNVEEEVESVLQTRLPLYAAAATIVVDADVDSPQTIADVVFDLIVLGDYGDDA